MSFLTGGAKMPAVQATPVTPRLSDAELSAKTGANQLRARKGLEDQILSLGKNSNDNSRTVSMLGRSAA